MAGNDAAGGGTSDGRSSVPSLTPPCPKSPPTYPDLYGKRRGLAKVQMLEREIGFLEEELKSTQGVQPSSRCCKEVTDFVAANPDPLISTNRKNRRSCRFRKWLRGIPCFNFSWICCCCCYSGCTLGQDPSECCACNPCDRCSGNGCPAPNCRSCIPCSCLMSNCCSKPSCSGCCTRQCPSCKDCCCCRVTFNCPKCPKVQCFQCKETCCTGCCLFF